VLAQGVAAVALLLGHAAAGQPWGCTMMTFPLPSTFLNADIAARRELL
jgi:hypothetical protein